MKKRFNKKVKKMIKSNEWDLELDHSKVLEVLKGLIGIRIPRVYEIDKNNIGTQVKGGKVVSLKLPYCGLKSLPESFGNLKSLQTLYLNYNKLKTFPDSISQLESLDELNLEGNKLTSLPDSIINSNLFRKNGTINIGGNSFVGEFDELNLCNYCEDISNFFVKRRQMKKKAFIEKSK